MRLALTSRSKATTIHFMSRDAFVAACVRRLFEDEHLLCVSKAAGVAIRRPDVDRACDVVDIVRHLGWVGGDATLRVVNAMGRMTSGVLILAKSAPAAMKLDSAISAGGVRRTYAAVVRGKAKSHSADDLALAPVRVHEEPEPRGRTDSTTSVVAASPRSLVRVETSTASEKRLREDLSKRHHPIVGDAIFDPRREGRASGRHYLHLERVAFEHPITGAPVNVTDSVPRDFESVCRGQRAVEGVLRTALAERLPWLMDGASDAYRAFDGRRDGLAGLNVDIHGRVAVMSVRQGRFPLDDGALHDAAEWYGRFLGIDAVYLKGIPRDRSHDESESTQALCDPQPLWGSAVPPEITAREDGLSYWVRPYDGFQTGLFLEHCGNRRWLKEHSAGRAVLNLFAYTCGLSVAAATGGALETHSVDTSKKALEWGKRNFEANGLALDSHRFYCSDVFEYYKRAERQERRFDLIVLDAPTFARLKKPARVFRVEADFVRLVREALPLLISGGVMLVSINQRRLSTGWMRERMDEAFKGRAYNYLPSPPNVVGIGGEDSSGRTVIVRVT
ncbi:MAG: methyltransferase [Phycisphaerales bacterium]|nr:methyltransferase [Phycisphaerales bacterium]